MDKLLKLPSCTIVTTGRTGTDFLQSLFDSHPQVLTFNSVLLYHNFWNNSVCVNAGRFDLSDFIDEFIGKHIERLKSRYDISERKDQLGENYNQSVDIDLNRFKSEVINLLKGQEVNSKNSMLAIYAAYSICLGQDIEKKTILLHHTHHFKELESYLKDFSDSKIICMTRDPRANFVSGIENWRRFRPSTDYECHLHFYIKRILEDATVLKKYNNEYIAIRIEDMGNERTTRRLCEWLNIPYNDCLKESTWGGMRWHGDRISAKKNKDKGWSKDMIRNDWEERLSSKDKYILNFLMINRLKHYGYNYKKVGILDFIILPFLILTPLTYEQRFFSFSYIRDSIRNKEYRKMASNVEFYLRRIYLFFKYYIKIVKKDKFAVHFLSSNEQL